MAGADTVQDFEQGIDRIVLSGGRNFPGLVITQGRGSDTSTANAVLRAGSAGEYLAVLLYTRANTLGAADFYAAGS